MPALTISASREDWNEVHGFLQWALDKAPALKNQDNCLKRLKQTIELALEEDNNA